MTNESLDEYLGKLGRAHDFSLEELAMNRTGKLHPAQITRRGGSPGLRASVVGFVALLVLGGGLTGAYFLYDDLVISARYGSGHISDVDKNGVIALLGGTLLVSLLLLVATWRTYAKAKKRRAVYERGLVELVEGPVQKIRVRHRQAGTTYRYEVGGRSFWVRERAWQLVTAGARYRVYCLGDELISLEPT